MESRDHLARPGQTVRQTVRLDVIDPEADGLSLEADLGYDPTDPYAMTIVFHTGTGPVAWSFGRELLVHGSYGPTGDGDVHIWPCLAVDSSAVVIIELSTPEDSVLLQAGARDIARFVGAMLDSVPLGAETGHLDLDAELSDLLAC
jgi:hypothetical protein